MSTWKRVLTTDDTDSISDTNLATNDLAQSSSARSYTLPTSSVSSSLQFKGNVDGNTETMLRIECDSDQAEPTQSYVYTPRLTIGNYSLSGAGGANGYAMPQFASAVNEGEVMVSDNFDTNSGEMSFKTFDEWMNCNPQGPGFQGSVEFQPNGCQPRADYMLAWDDTVDQYQPIKLSELQKVMGYRTAYNFGRSGQVTANGAVTMRTANGAEGAGVVIPENSRIVGVSWRGYLSNTDGSINAGVRFTINDNSQYTGYQSYQFNQVSNVSNGWRKGYTMFATPLELNAGDDLDIYVNFSGSSNAVCSNQSVVVMLDSYLTNVQPPETLGA